MSRDPRYQKLLNSKRWQEVKRQVFRRTNGLCERCREEGIAAGILPDGYIKAGVDCHHIIPVESGRTEQEMEKLAYSLDNIRLLCLECHIKTHAEMGSHTREYVQENKKRKRNMFLQRNDPNYVDPDAEGNKPAADDGGKSK